MDAALVASLESICSAPRLQRYKDAATRNGVTDNLEIAVLYCWNLRLAEALLPGIAVLEVVIRNRVHEALTNYAQGSEFWFQQVIQPRQADRYRSVTRLHNKLSSRHGVPPTAGKLVSEFTFGFWQNLFTQRYHGLWWDAGRQSRITQVIPNYPKVGRDTRNKLEVRLEYMVELRNRAVHHEALFQGVAAINRPRLAIDILHEQLLETISWVNTDARRIVDRFDQFDTVFHSGKVTV